MFPIAKIACPPVSSHIVPNNSTPIVFCSSGSDTFPSASKVSCIAFFAASPPSPNAFFVASMSIPNSLKALSAVPSFTLIENSFTASPNLSISKTPASAPFLNILNISEAESPICANFGPYSFIESSRLSFLFSPFCAPCATRSNASSEDNPNCVIS